MSRLLHTSRGLVAALACLFMAACSAAAPRETAPSDELYLYKEVTSATQSAAEARTTVTAVSSAAANGGMVDSAAPTIANAQKTTGLTQTLEASDTLIEEMTLEEMN